MKTLCFSPIVLVVALMSCAEPEAPETPFNTTINMHEFMVWYLEPAADVIWDSAGFVITEDGEVDLQPTTQEGWDHVRNSATVVSEGGNLLMLPGFAADDADWMDYASGLVVAGVKARDAAFAKDADALFDAGGQIYSVCRACHNRYIIEPTEGAGQ